MFRYKKIGYVALNVNDLDKSTKFYEQVVGLQHVETNEKGLTFFRCSNDHHNVILYPSTESGIKRVGFQLENDQQLEIAYSEFVKNGLHPREVSETEQKELKQGRSFRIVEPNTGLELEFYSKMMYMIKDFAPKHTKIQRLGHVVLNCVDVESTIKFFVEKLNFIVSDHLGENAWLRCFPNPYHHSFALIKNTENKLHHVNFMVEDIDDIGIARNRILNGEVPIAFGPGRHEPSESIFFYFLDPDGMTMEYSFGMEEFPEDNARDARLLETSPWTLDRWGGKPSPEFASKGKIEKKLDSIVK
ncbi:VOC family protein [Bacillus sp. EB600]|uniref:VOC family protein n=1 Tax=Bacillus sp. EB600 TaxID=2806345 RepID=UPI00210CC4EA|nr:VOC family protein [Bacillus sp. EB600]MCQ6279955.1 VOC family protein [Bacillus sp. EB600]